MNVVAKQLVFIASARKDLQSFPEGTRWVMGVALREAQLGRKSERARPLKVFGGASVLEIVDDNDGDTYRTVYTLEFPRVVYVLHAFQKKSKNGIGTPKPNIDLIKSRLRAAKADYEDRGRSLR